MFTPFKDLAARINTARREQRESADRVTPLEEASLSVTLERSAAAESPKRGVERQRFNSTSRQWPAERMLDRFVASEQKAAAREAELDRAFKTMFDKPDLRLVHSSPHKRSHKM